MLDAGYQQVGRDFPVFLHPQTARRIRAGAYRASEIRFRLHGFTPSPPDVTTEADLQRRDLTINALARDDDGQIIDPYHGRRDLEARLLRHVSPARLAKIASVLRVAHFAARYAHLSFRIADETLALMRGNDRGRRAGTSDARNGYGKRRK